MWGAFKEISAINHNIVEGEKIRQKQLQDILNFAKENIPFYKGGTAKTLSDFPVVNKQMILANREAFLAPMEAIPGQKGELHIQKTSGSSGIPFSLPQDTLCRIKRIALIKYANEQIGFHSFMPLMHLRAHKRHGRNMDDYIYNKKLNILYVDNGNIDDAKALEICNLVNEYGIKYIRGYMTTLDIITRYAVEHGISFTTNPTFISVGELLKESLRQRVILMGAYHFPVWKRRKWHIRAI